MSNIQDSPPPPRKLHWRGWLSRWGFSIDEERALFLILGIILLGGATKYWRANRLEQRLEIISTSAAVDSSFNTGQPPIAADSSQLINVNAADLKTLVLLPGIGPVRAQAIIDFRRQFGDYKTPDDLLQVKGIGPLTVKEIAPLIQFTDP